MKKVQKRRRLENKTDYAKRLNLLKGSHPRIVVRKTNRYIIAQYAISKEAQDSIKTGIVSKELLNFGWPKEAEGSLKSITAAYLTGLLFGKKIISKGLSKDPIIDIGMTRKLHKTKIYGFVKGLADAGVSIKYKEGVFPDEKRIRGEHLKSKGKIKFDEIKSKIGGLK